MTQAAVAPPTFVFFTTDPTSIHFSYRRYLENRLRDAYDFDRDADPPRVPRAGPREAAEGSRRQAARLTAGPRGDSPVRQPRRA